MFIKGKKEREGERKRKGGREGVEKGERGVKKVEEGEEKAVLIYFHYEEDGNTLK